MQFKVEKLKKSQVKITVEVPEDKMARFKEKAVEKISRDIKVKGFRPGHAPLHVIEKEVGKDLLMAQTVEIAIPMTYSEIVQKEKLQVISRPKINILSEEPLKYEAEVAVLPELKVKDYDKIKVKKLENKADKKEVDEAISYMQKSFAENKEIDRPLKEGDKAEIDFEGFDEKGVSLENTKSKNHPLILGEKTLIRDFENKLVGLKKGDKKEFTVTFPEKYHAKSLEGKKVKFKVEIKKTEEVIIPEIDEALIEKVTGKKMSVKEFKEDVVKNIEARVEKENKMKQENEFLEEVIKRTEVEIPEILIEEEVDFILQDLKRDLQNRGMKYEDFLKQADKKEEDLRKKYAEEAEKRVKLRLALNHIFEIEKFEVTEKEAKAEIEKVIQFYPEAEKEKVRSTYEVDRNLQVQMRNRLLLEKMFDKLLKVG